MIARLTGGLADLFGLGHAPCGEINKRLKAFAMN
jgi:hypothetical protein